MKYVLDSSVTVKWVRAEAESDKTLRLRDDLRKSVHELLSPDIFTVEASHALTRAERQGRIAAGQARTLLLDIPTTSPRVFPFQPFLLGRSTSPLPCGSACTTASTSPSRSTRSANS